MSFQPLNSHSFVQPLVSEQVNNSGLQVSVKLKKAIVIKGGINSNFSPCNTKDGDTILYQDGVGIPYIYDGIEGLFIHERDILSII